MASGFSIAISATDGASAKIDAINKRLAAMNAPVDRVQKSLAKFADLSGINKLRDGLSGMASAGVDVFRNIMRIVEPLAAITGAASLAGMAAMVARWSEFGTKLMFSAQRMGMTSEALMTLQNAGRLAGISAEAMTSGLTSLNDNLTNAAAGRAPEATMAFNYLGFSLRDAAGHIKSAGAAMPELADKIAGIKNPTIQAQVATMLFGGAAEQLLPFLRKGSEGMQTYMDTARRYGVMNAEATQAADQLRYNMAEVTLSVEGLGNSISLVLAPVIGPLLHDMAEWIARNRELIAGKVAEYVKKIADFAASIDWNGIVRGASSFATSVNDVVKGLGGWQTLLEAIIAIKLLSWAGRVVAAITPLVALLGAIPGGSAAAATGIAAAGAEATTAGVAIGALAGPFIALAAAFYGLPRVLRWGLEKAFGVQEGAPGAAQGGGRGSTHGNEDAPSGVVPGGKLGGAGRGSTHGNQTERGVAKPFQGSQQQFYDKAYQTLLAEGQKQGVANPEALARLGAAQASNESGFGKHAPNNNFFGIKGGGSSQATQEFVGGKMVDTKANFRGYASLEDSASDYVTFLRKNSRYGGVLAAKNSADAIHAQGQTGYATDPNYEAKLAAIDARARTAQAPPANINGGTGAPQATASAGTVKGSADVNVTFRNAPAGTRTTASTSGDLFKPPRVEKVMAMDET